MSGFSHLPLSVIRQSARRLGNLSFVSSVFLQFLEPQHLKVPGSFVEISHRKKKRQKDVKEKLSTHEHSGKKILSCITCSSMLDVPGRMASTSEWLRPFSSSSSNVASCTWSQILGWTPQPVCAYCQVLQWEHGQQNGTGAIPAPASCTPMSCPWHGSSCLARGRDGGAAGSASVSLQASFPLRGHGVQVTMASGIICRDFLHLQRVQRSESLLFGNSGAQS